MKRHITFLLIICLLLSLSCVGVGATTEKTTDTDKEVFYGVSYAYNSSNLNKNLFEDIEVAQLFARVEESIVKEPTKNTLKLSELLTQQEILFLEEKDIDPSVIEVSIVEAVFSSETVDATKGYDTVSYTKTRNYSFSNILGYSTFKLGATWNVYKPTGGITIISTWLNHISGPQGQPTSPIANGNKISVWHSFFNGSQTVTYSFGFRLTSGGSIIQT